MIHLLDVLIREISDKNVADEVSLEGPFLQFDLGANIFLECFFTGDDLFSGIYQLQIKIICQLGTLDLEIIFGFKELFSEIFQLDLRILNSGVVRTTNVALEYLAQIL